jgi:hypothetical protein
LWSRPRVIATYRFSLVVDSVTTTCEVSGLDPAAPVGHPGTGDLGCKKRGRKSGGGRELAGQRAQGVRKKTMKM